MENVTGIPGTRPKSWVKVGRFLFHEGEREPFESGDLMFVAAGTEHRFEDFTEDLTVWVVFYGTHGGEVPA